VAQIIAVVERPGDASQPGSCMGTITPPSPCERVDCSTHVGRVLLASEEVLSKVPIAAILAVPHLTIRRRIDERYC
jgi:hypothetical protein